ncbi:MAG: thiolase family protein [Solirubrobacterales bacterium]|jgi:acetyl-CoA C-acetyltransferase
MREVVIAGAVRTPIGKFGGALAGLTAAQVGAAAAAEALRRSGVPLHQVDEAVIGCARQAGGGPNVARQVAFHAGLPQEVPAFTVNMACASGLKAIGLAFQSVRDGDAEAVLAGGVESMSRVPYLLPGARWGYRMGHQELVDGMYQDGFQCPLAGQVMGETAETLAAQYEIGRDEQDSFALRSQERAARALAEGRFESETVAVKVPGKKGDVEFTRDEHPRETTPESLRKLPPAFKAEGGSVTAGNSSGITDGAAAMVLLSQERAAALGLKPMARILGVAAAGVDPKVMGIGVVPAVKKLLERLSLRLGQFDLLEVNEAFAAQVLACDRELGFDAERLNVNGGSIALGHPIGATGARIVVTLLHEMARRRARLGLATLCVSGGMGFAAAFEAVTTG